MKYVSILFCFILFFVGCNIQKEDPTIPLVSYGRIVRLDSFSSSFVAPRNVDIWLPEGYQKKGAYPVLYMNDGQMLFDSTKTWIKRLDIPITFFLGKDK